MNEFLGFGVSGYRSIGPPVQRIGPLGKISVLAGANNSGKSNVLTFAATHLRKVVECVQNSRPFTLTGLDVPRDANARELTFSVPVRTDEISLAEWAAHFAKGKESNIRPERIQSFIKQVLSLNEFSPGDGISWLDVDPSASSKATWFRSEMLDKLSQKIAGHNTAYGPTKEEWYSFWAASGHQTGGDWRQHWVPESLHRLLSSKLSVPQVQLVPAFRQIVGTSTGDNDDLSGRGLIRKLAQLERPSIHEQEKKAKFVAIVDFVRAVTRAQDAMLEVPHELDTLHVRLNGRTLPISNLGTGIHQVILIAAAATLHDDSLLCLEEPELHLHPLLQQELIRYLVANTSNRYLISTHSASFLDATDASVFRVNLVNGATQIELAKSHEDHFAICVNLGYQASDLLQCNAVIWVEGPSDRVYVLEWLRQVAPDLKEGLHFSVMFYGGSLLTHVSAAQKNADQFAQLRRLNRSFAIIMDSDRRKAGAPISEAKARIVKELDGDRCLAWVLACRTIENYVSLSAWKQAVTSVHPTAIARWNGNRFQDPFTGLPASRDKIAIAEALRDMKLIDVERHDLSIGLPKLVKLIRAANPAVGVPSASSR